MAQKFDMETVCITFVVLCDMVAAGLDSSCKNLNWTSQDRTHPLLK